MQAWGMGAKKTVTWMGGWQSKSFCANYTPGALPTEASDAG